MSARYDDPDRDRSPVPILLILGLALGIPAVLGLLVLGGFFLLGLAVFQAEQEMQAEMEEAMNQQAQVEVGEFHGPVLNAIAQPAPPPGVPGKVMVDLIPLIDPQIDAIDNRKWSVINNVLHCPDAHFVPRIQIPYQPPQEYDFVVTFSQPALRNGISMIMPNPNGGSFFWYVGSGDGAEYGLASSPNITGRIPGLVQPNTACTTVVQVRRGSIRCLVNGVERLNRQTDFRELQSDNWRAIRDPSLLALACDDPTVFHYVRVVEISGPGKRTR